jgi:DNA-binding NarL/FixJ family response regulator
LATSAEIEELIVRLHKEGKTTREISKVVHKNFTYIGAVLRKRFPEEYANNKSTATSIETQAVDLFSKGKGPIHVVRKLNIKIEEAKKLYSDYLDATNYHTLTTINNGEDYQKIRHTVEEQVKGVMNDRMMIIEIAVNATIDALQMNLAKKSFNNPYMQIAISGYSEQEVQYLRSNVLEIAKGLFERTIADFTMLTREEKEILVIELYKQGKTIREIAKEVHMSFSRISKIINEYEGTNSEKKVPVSKDTKALKLFKKGKDLVYVTTKLDMKPEDIKKMYLEYLNLQGLPSLKDMHNELGNSLPSFVQAYKKIVRSGIGIDKVIRVAEILDEIPQIQNQYNELRDNVQQLFQLKYSVTGELNRLKNQINPLQNYFNSLNYQYKVINARRQVI